MKTLLRSFLIMFFAAGISLNAQAQTSLTAGNYSPVLGDHFILKVSNYMQPGSAGANQTWNFSAMTTSSTGVNDYIGRASAPYPASLPAAQLVSKSSSNEYMYFETAPNALRIHGLYVAAQNLFMSYSNSLDMALPLSYNIPSTDTYKATYTANGLNFARTGSVQHLYDGYGTLITPSGTFLNVVRLKISDMARDSANMGGGFPLIMNTITETYDYILPGVHSPIARLVKVISGANTQTRAFYLDYAALGEKEDQAIATTLKLYPNPATASATLQYQLKRSGKVKITLLNLVGQEVKQLQNGLQTTEMQTQYIPLEVLPKGVYFVKIAFEDQVTTKRLVVQ